MEIVRDADDPERVLQLLVTWSSWQGPLPHPDALAAFNKAYDGCAREIVEMTRSQSDHRQTIERQVISADVTLRQRGQYCGFVIAMTAIIGGLALAGLGRSLTGFGTILLGVGSVVGLFLYTRRRQASELATKREALERSNEDDA